MEACVGGDHPPPPPPGGPQAADRPAASCQRSFCSDFRQVIACVAAKGLRDSEEDCCEPQRFKFLCHGLHSARSACRLTVFDKNCFRRSYVRTAVRLRTAGFPGPSSLSLLLASKRSRSRSPASARSRSLSLSFSDTHSLRRAHSLSRSLTRSRFSLALAGSFALSRARSFSLSE
jgi:hypothetical protein